MLMLIATCRVEQKHVTQTQHILSRRPFMVHTYVQFTIGIHMLKKSNQQLIQESLRYRYGNYIPDKKQSSSLWYKDLWISRQTQAHRRNQMQVAAVEDFNHAAELKCQGRALTFPGNPTPCPLSAGEQRTQKGAGQGELCHRDEGWGEGQREGG